MPHSYIRSDLLDCKSYFYQMRKIVQHTLFWIVIAIMWTFMKTGGWESPQYAVVNLVNVPIYMAVYYLLRHVQIPYLYNRDRYVLFGLSLVATSLFFCVIWRVLVVLWFDDFQWLKDRQFLSLYKYLLRSVQFYSPAMGLLAWEAFSDRKKAELRAERLEKEKLATELKFLKAQINPHFLFNTLNNLYSSVVTNSPHAPDMIMKLSGILDYVLYKSQNESVPLSEEVATIENFIGLEEIRYGERLQVDFEKEGNFAASISPLILLSIVENAFKHGASGDIDSPKIRINISSKDDKIHCNVWNTKSKYKGELNDAYKEGIGLSNIKRQLNLIYPERYDLKIEDGENDFEVSLKIDVTRIGNQR